jgi:acyl carrier protein phosphodiesterase
MNFLAHLYLSGDDNNLIIGNFIADMVKGNKINGYNPEITRGIMLHRQIDTFTDNHKIVKVSKERLRSKYRLYSGVIVDMYYDHFLAKNWTFYSGYSLPAYADKAYALLRKHHNILPARAQYILPFMTENNWLVNYANTESMSLYFGGMSRRTPFHSGMENAVEDLLEHYALFENEFLAFFPELMTFVEEQGVSHAHHRAC